MIDDSANMTGVTTFNSQVQFEDSNSGTTINGGSMGGGNINMAGNVIALRAHTLNVVSGTLTMSNWDGNAGYSFTKSGNGTMVINGAGTNTGSAGFSLSGGTLIIGNKSSLGGGTFTLGLNTTLKASTDLTGANAITNGFTVNSGTDGTRISGTNSIEITGTATGENAANANSKIINNLDSGKTLTLSNIAINTGRTGVTFGISGTGNTVIGGVISNGAAGANNFDQSGTGTTTLTGANTYTGTTQVGGGVLTLKTATGSLASTTLKFYGSTGTFNADNVGAVAAKSFNLGALSLNASISDATVKITRSANYDQAITFSSITARKQGGALNFVNTGGTASAANGFVITGQAAGFMDQGIFYNGSNYAWYDSGGFVRAINYGVDAGSVTSAGGTSVTAATNVRITGAITAQTNGATFTTLEINGANNFTFASGAGLTVYGILKSGGGSATISGGNGLSTPRDSKLNNDLVVRVDQATDSLTIGSAIGNQNTTSVTKTGQGTLTLTASNSFNGNMLVDEGTLSVSANNQLGVVATGASVSLRGGTLQATATFALDNAGANIRAVNLSGYNTIDVTGSNALTINGVVSTDGNNAGNPTLAKSGTGTLVLAGANTYQGDTVVSGGTLQIGSGGTTGQLATNANSTIVNNATLAFNRSDTVTQGTNFANFISGTGQLVQAGAGTLVLAAGNTYTGATVVNSGILSIGTPAAISSSSGVSIANGAGLTYTGTNSTVLNRNITITSGTGTLRNSGGQTLTLSGTLTKDGTVLKFGQGTFTVTGSIVGSGANSDLLVDSAAVTLSSTSNTYNGPTYIRNGGALTASVTDALPTSTRSALVMDDSGTGSSTFTLGANQHIASLTGALSSSVALGANALTVGTSSGTNTFAGVIGGSGGSLVKDGNSVQILSGNNTYSGATDVRAGALVVDGSIAGAITVSNGATLAGSGKIGGLATISGNLNPGNSPGILTFSNGLTLNSTAVTTMEIGGTNAVTPDFDQIAVTGALAYGGTLTITNWGSYYLTNIASYNLFDSTGYSGNFSTVTVSGLGLAFDSIKTWSGTDTNSGTIYTFTLDDGILSAAAVPEPSTYALLGLAGAALAAYRLRRRNK